MKYRDSLKLEFKNYWFKLYVSMTDGDVTQIEALKRTEVFEFYELLKVFEERQENEIKRYEQTRNKMGNNNPRKKKG